MAGEIGELYDLVLKGDAEAFRSLSVMAWSSPEARQAVNSLDDILTKQKPILTGIEVRVADLGEGGVRQSDWSVSDQEAIRKGGRPKGCPNHLNV